MPHFDTEPFEQLLSEEEVEAAKRIHDRSQRRNKKRYQGSEHPSPDDRPEGPFGYYAPQVTESSHESFMQRFISFFISDRDPWRLGMGCAVLFLMVNAGAGRGWLNIPGLPQLAEASTVTQVRVDQLDGQIEDAKKGHCLAPTHEGKRYYFGRLRELQRKYEDATHEKYSPVPTCTDLGVEEVRVDVP